jgi:hypothetical protein
MVGLHWEILATTCAFFLVGFLVPIVIGFAYVLPDANRRGQPGWLWAVLTIPLGWIALLAYLVVRSLQAPAAPR